jgi:ParB-like chromosome segregation protein Spo0J
MVIDESGEEGEHVMPGDVHPVAALFPMMADAEIAQLAEDIKRHGLLQALIRDGDVLIDGRNRLLACKRAGVEPRFEDLGDRDAVAVILSANISRRHLTVGQRAMVLALAEAEAKEGGAALFRLKRGTKKGVLAAAGVGATSLRLARFVRDHASDLVEQVMAGSSLVAAEEAGRKRQQQQVNREAERKRRLAALEERRKRLENERETLLARIAAERDEIGPAVTLPPEPELTLRFTPGPDGETIAFPEDPVLGPSLEEQDRLLKRMLAVKREILAVAAAPVIEDAYPLEQHVMAVRSWASAVVKAVYDMVEAHNEALRQGRTLRRVQ